MTKSQMYFRMVTSSLMRRRSRMIVALLAIAIGATVLSGLVTIYYDVPRQLGKEFRSYGANLIITSKTTEPFLEQDLALATAIIPAQSTVGVTPFVYRSVKINQQPFVLAGTDFAEVSKTSPYWYVNGSFPKQSDSVIEALFGQEAVDILGISTGKECMVSGTAANGKAFDVRVKVSGILQTGGSEEHCIYLNKSDFYKITGEHETVDVAECSVSLQANELDAVAAKIEETLPMVKASAVKRVARSEGAVLGKLQALVYLVTIVVLVLTMVCVATTMMAVVAERRKEIGLKKALGASNKEIAGEFLGEGLLLGAFGGALGVVLGFFFAQGVSMSVFLRPIAFQPLIIPLTIVVSVVVTGIACLIPVRSAADVDPAIVLKGE